MENEHQATAQTLPRPIAAFVQKSVVNILSIKGLYPRMSQKFKGTELVSDREAKVGMFMYFAFYEPLKMDQLDLLFFGKHVVPTALECCTEEQKTKIFAPTKGLDEEHVEILKVFQRRAMSEENAAIYGNLIEAFRIALDQRDQITRDQTSTGQNNAKTNGSAPSLQ
ncbi:MAG: hypothetical protein PHE27_03095 [Alphaproteobacteria bacterium]|nr:hypothetical protein [Alphaproteobacteria bacterium]